MENEKEHVEMVWNGSGGDCRRSIAGGITADETGILLRQGRNAHRAGNQNPPTYLYKVNSTEWHRFVMEELPMFKIRKKIFPDVGYEICEEKYIDFLEKKRKFFDEDLFMMFHHDYFHDGNLLNFQYDFKNSQIKLHLLCPNFVSPKHGNINIDFSLNFYDIKYFQVNSKIEHPVFTNAVFLHGELGTLACSNQRMSLIMEFITPPQPGKFWLSIISKRIEIIPREALAFQLLFDSHEISLEE